MFRSNAERKVAEAGYDPARLPPGQYLTPKWPVLHVGDVPALEPVAWDLRVFGEVEEPLRLNWEELRALPAVDVTADIHCVTRWSRFDARFRGVRFAELARRARPTAAARFVVAHAEAGYTANLPLSALDEPGSLVAYEADGEPLAPEHGGPVRLIVPSRYFWKSAKWLRALELRADDEPGTWERYGYSNDADPWREERYAL
ncbi:MAG TPA: sulfite oxidase-like oxidoreductase [Gaiellaceae bacterium]|nr:sulfite oxidase-like oxidoreductase [Gaiellaceae bacterium]